MVWNSEPRPGDTATWVGDRSREGYAAGFGTLTWYTAKGEIYARYYGHMVQGKFDGPVNAHSKGKTAHATFDNGKRIGPWRKGNATLRGGFADDDNSSKPASNEKTRKTAAAKPAKIQEATPDVEPTPVKEKPNKFGGQPVTAVPTKETAVKLPKKETPKKTVASAQPTPIPAATERPAPSIFPVPTPAAAEKKSAPGKKDMDPSLKSLVGPPASLESLHRQESERAESNAPLTEKEVVDLANTVAKSRGYNPSNYREPDIKHNEQDNTWSLSYQAKEGEGTSDAKHLDVSIDGNTKRASVTPSP